MFRKPFEAVYLDNLLQSMDSTRMMLLDCPPDRVRATDWIASCLSDLVKKIYMAFLGSEYADSKAATVRLKSGCQIPESSKMNIFTFVEALILDSNGIAAIGRQRSVDCVQDIGGDGILQFEYGHEGHADFRRKAVRAVLPSSEAFAMNAYFEAIIKATW